jgi:hypothetical protein
VTGLAEGASHTFAITAVNGAGHESQYSATATGTTWYAPTIWGYSINNGVVWTGSPVAVTVGQSVKVQLLFYSGNPPATFSVLSGPSTASIDSNTGLIRYTPAASEVGTVDMTFQASNAVCSSTIAVQFDVSA